MNKKILLIAITLVLINLGYILAEDNGVQITQGSPYSLEAGGVGSLEKFLHLLKENEFIITQTGIDRQCDNIRTGSQVSISVGNGASVSASSVCTSGHAQIIAYSKMLGDSTLYPKLEFRDSGTFNCAAASGKEKCVVEFYCCPYAECGSNTDCVNQKGSGSQCTSRNYVYYDGLLQLPKYYSNDALSTTYKACTAGSGCVAKTCSQLGKTCGTWDNKCGTNLNCGACSSGKVCSGGVCVNQACNPDCSCASDTCSGETCSNGCGGNCVGTKICSSNPIDSNPVDNLPTVNDPDINAEIVGITLGDSNGNLLDTSKPLMPGQKIQVSFSVKTTYGNWKAHLSVFPNEWATKQKEFLVEGGIVPGSVAQDWNFPTPTFSIFDNLGGTKKSVPTECCTGMKNVQAFKTTISQSIDQAVIQGSIKDTDVIAIPYTMELVVPNKATVDLCPVNGVSTKYWDSSSNDYVIYLIIKNGCTAIEGELTGYDKAIVQTGKLIVDVGANTTNPSGSNEGEPCEQNFQCASGICESHWYGGRCSKVSGPGSSGSNISLIKKFPLSKEEISKSTSGDLISAACYKSNECGERDNYSSSCIPVSKLKTDGTLTVQQEQDLFSDGKAIVTTGLIGGGTAVTLCAIGIGTGVFSGGATTLIGCGIGGALLVTGLSELTSSSIIQVSDIFSSDLQKAISSGDSAKVGICTAEPVTTFDIGAFISKVGGMFPITHNATTDGLIIIVGGFVILMFIFSVLGKK